MVPVMCLVKNDPPNSHGDCVRACLASIMEMRAEDVPHFFDNEGMKDVTAANIAMREWLLMQGYAPFYMALEDEFTFDECMQYMRNNNPSSVYMLWHQTNGGSDHCVIGRGDKIVHNPAWYASSIAGPHSSGFWIFIAICKV